MNRWLEVQRWKARNPPSLLSPSHLIMPTCTVKGCKQPRDAHLCKHEECGSKLTSHRGYMYHANEFHCLVALVESNGEVFLFFFLFLFPFFSFPFRGCILMHSSKGQSLTLTRNGTCGQIACTWEGCQKVFSQKQKAVIHVKTEHFSRYTTPSST